MTEKMKTFCLEYLVDRNATQAAIRAGYSKRSAGQIGEENLKKPEIQEFMENLKKEIIDDRETIILENILFWNRMKNDPKIKPADRIKCTELLGRYSAMFTDNTNVNVSGSLAVDVNEMSDEDIDAKIKEYEQKGKD